MSGSLLAERRFAPLFACQFLSAFGDNFLRNALGLLVVWSSGGAPGWIVAAASGAFVLPSVLLSGLGGQLADRMDKARLIRRLKFAEIVVAAVATLGLALGSLPVLFTGLVASGVVAALFGPVKYGILPDQLPRERLTGANALVEGATFAAILAGTVASGMLVSAGVRPLVVGVVVLATATLSWATALLVPATLPSAPVLRVQADIFASTLDLVRGLRADRRIWRAVLANAWFWMAGSVVIALLPGLVRDTLGGGAGLDTVCLCLFAVGIACGSGLASFLSGARTVLLPATAGSGVFGLALLDLWRVSHGLGHAPLRHVGADLFAAAFGGGLLAVPTQAAIQAFSPPERRARTVAGGNVVGALAITATAVVLVAAQLAGLREPVLLGVTGLLCLGAAAVMLATLSPNLPGEAAWVLFRMLFRIRLIGAEHLPRADQAAVVTPNHTSWLDATALFAVMETPPLFAIDAQVARRWWVRPFLRVVPTLPVEASSPYVVRTMVQAVQGGVRLILRTLDSGDLAQARATARLVGEAAGHGGALTERMLAVARRGGGAPDAAALDPAQAVAQACELLRRTLGAGVTVRCEVAAEGLPPRVRGDRAELEAALLNLAVNARDAMPAGGELTVSLAPEVIAEGVAPHPAGLPAGRYARIAVADTGVGMDAATLARATEAFFTTKPAGRGTGLGLSTVRGFAEEVGGALRIESEPGRGTTVTLWLPAAEPDGADPPAGAATRGEAELSRP